MESTNGTVEVCALKLRLSYIVESIVESTYLKFVPLNSSSYN